jgi:hypothetical protein
MLRTVAVRAGADCPTTRVSNTIGFGVIVNPTSGGNGNVVVVTPGGKVVVVVTTPGGSVVVTPGGTCAPLPLSPALPTSGTPGYVSSRTVSVPFFGPGDDGVKRTVTWQVAPGCSTVGQL